MPAFDWSLLGAPLLAGLLVVLTHVLLGRQVLKRGIIFIDLTIAQVAALGVIVASAAGLDGAPWLSQIIAAGAALLAAALLSWTELRWRELQEALIGSLYVVAACLALLVLANNPHGAEQMQSLLAGQILWVGFPQLAPIAGLYAAILALWALWGRAETAAFYFLFALTITASVQLVGVYLVFASLILPALAAVGLATRRGLAVGYSVGVLAYALGLWLSLAWDLPAGPLIVCLLAVLSLSCTVLRSLIR